MEKKLLAVMQAIISYEWIVGGFEKIAESHAVFVVSFTKSIGFFASKNPHPGYKDFLTGYVLPNKEMFGYLIPWSEFLVGIALLIGAVLIFTNRTNKIMSVLVSLALVGAILMNINFWFAAGWTGPATAGLNIVLGLSEAALLVYWTRGLLKVNKK